MTNPDRPSTQQSSAQLGCGTLILIAIIVSLFSGRGDLKEVRDEVSALRDQVTRLEAKIDSLNISIEAVRQP
jgi:hypothetical protein